MRIESRRFGQLEVEDEDLVDFGGLPGFPAARRFALLAHDRDSAFAWLVCADVPELAFVVTDPWQFFEGYKPEIPTETLQQIGTQLSEEVDCLVIATVRPGGATLNLAAPLLVNPRTRQGRQVILEGDTYSTRAPMPVAAARELPGGAQP